MTKTTTTPHTPGPWHDRVATGVPDHMISSRAAGFDGPRGVCVIPFKYGEGTGTATRNANARLIAAAPDMLALLRGLVAADAINHAGARVLVNDCIAEARALVARIDGAQA